jgi:DNA-binding MarR family transcriptional regulator
MTDSTFGFERAEDSPGLLLWQTTTLWQRRIKKTLESYDISHAQFVIMAILLWFEEQQLEETQTAIVNLSKLDKMTVSQALKKLLSSGMITRVEHAQDARAKSVSLTRDGKTRIQQLIPIVEAIDSQFFGGLSSNQQASLTDTLNTLVRINHES